MRFWRWSDISEVNRITIIFCLYGFFKDLKPSEPFLTPFLIDDKGFTNQQTEDEIYPVWTYAQVVALAFVGILAETVGYKFVIILECLAYLTTRCLLIWGTTLLQMQIMQAVYAIGTATTIVYYSYIYLLVSEMYFQRVTSLTRAAVTCGVMTSGVLGQLLVSLAHVDYMVLNYISFASVSIACLIALFFPNDCHMPRWFNGTDDDGQGCFFSLHYDKELPQSAHSVCPSEKSLVEILTPSSLSTTSADEQLYYGDEDEEDLALERHNALDVDAFLEQADPDYQESSSPALVSSIAKQHAGHASAQQHKTRRATHAASRSRSRSRSSTLDALEIEPTRDLIDNRDAVETTQLLSMAAHQSNLPFADVRRAQTLPDIVDTMRGEAMFRCACSLAFISSWGFLRWSLWWVLGNAGDSLLTNYVQNLWVAIDPSQQHVLYGGVESVATLVGSAASLLPALFEGPVTKYGEFFLCFMSVMSALLVIVMSVAQNVWVAYVSYILYRGCYYFLIALASAQVALRMRTKRYALVFGTNLFLSSVIQSIVTLILGVTDVDIRVRFFVFAMYFFFIALVFMIAFSYVVVSRWRARRIAG